VKDEENDRFADADDSWDWAMQILQPAMTPGSIPEHSTWPAVINAPCSSRRCFSDSLCRLAEASLFAVVVACPDGIGDVR